MQVDSNKYGAGYIYFNSKNYENPEAEADLAKEAVEPPVSENLSKFDKYLEQKQKDVDNIKDDIKRMREDAKRTTSSINDFAKAIKIANRIVGGDIVPSADDKFLLERYPSLHLQSWMMRKSRETPVKHKSILSEKDKKSIHGKYYKTNKFGKFDKKFDFFEVKGAKIDCGEKSGDNCGIGSRDRIFDFYEDMFYSMR